MTTGLTEEEAQRYDRQVRIWGAEAQLRMQTSTILVCGFRGLHVEVVKNIVLMGVGVVIQDDAKVTADDLSHNFFLSFEDIGKNVAESCLGRVQDLNSFAKVSCEVRSIESLEDSYLSRFDVVLATNCSDAHAARLSQLCRSSTGTDAKTFFWSQVFGTDALFMSDFGPSFRYKDDPPNNKDVRTISFPSLEAVLQKPWTSAVSRFFPLSLTYVKSRILSKFMEQHGRYPAIADSDALIELTKVICEQQGILSSEWDSSSSSSSLLLSQYPALTSEDIRRMAQTSTSAPVIVCSVLGSYLAQEVVKAVSKSGEPGFNTFVFDSNTCDVICIPMAKQ